MEKLRELASGPADPWQALGRPDLDAATRRDHVAPESLATFERNVRSFAALARSRGAGVILVTQPVRIRAAQRAADLAWLAGWYPGLKPEAVPQELERLNDVLRRLGSLHYTGEGRRKLVEYLAPRAVATFRRRR